MSVEGSSKRWLELLSYIMALVYHGREQAEHAELQQVVEGSVKTDEHRQEVFAMGQTMAEFLKEQGRVEGRREGEHTQAIATRQETLVRQLRKRFTNIPRKIVARIEATHEIHQLDTWLDNVVTAKSLDDVGI